MIKAECRFTEVSVILPLKLRIIDALAGQLILQFNRYHRNTVDRQHHIHRIMILCRIMPLSDTLADILIVMLHGNLVQRGFRLEIADLEIHPTVLEAMPKNRQNTIHLYCIFKHLIEFLVWIRVALLFKALPHNRLRRFHELNQCINI